MTGATVAALLGALRLVAGDKRGLAAMDTSLEGFWRSFAVMLWLTPAVALSIFADLRFNEMAGTPREAPALVVVAGVTNFVLGWIAFPLLLAVLGRALGLERAYVRWMVARNWTSVPALIPYVGVVLLWLMGILPLHALGPATLTALGFSLFCGWRVAVLAGERPWGAAIAYTLVDFLLGLVVETAADRLLGL